MIAIAIVSNAIVISKTAQQKACANQKESSDFGLTIVRIIWLVIRFALLKKRFRYTTKPKNRLI